MTSAPHLVFCLFGSRGDAWFVSSLLEQCIAAGAAVTVLASVGLPPSSPQSVRWLVLPAVPAVPASAAAASAAAHDGDAGKSELRHLDAVAAAIAGLTPPPTMLLCNLWSLATASVAEGLRLPWMVVTPSPSPALLRLAVAAAAAAAGDADESAADELVLDSGAMVVRAALTADADLAAFVTHFDAAAADLPAPEAVGAPVPQLQRYLELVLAPLYSPAHSAWRASKGLRAFMLPPLPLPLVLVACDRRFFPSPADMRWPPQVQLVGNLADPSPPRCRACLSKGMHPAGAVAAAAAAATAGASASSAHPGARASAASIATMLPAGHGTGAAAAPVGADALCMCNRIGGVCTALQAFLSERATLDSEISGRYLAPPGTAIRRTEHDAAGVSMYGGTRSGAELGSGGDDDGDDDDDDGNAVMVGSLNGGGAVGGKTDALPGTATAVMGTPTLPLIVITFGSMVEEVAAGPEGDSSHAGPSASRMLDWASALADTIPARVVVQLSQRVAKRSELVSRATFAARPLPSDSRKSTSASVPFIDTFIAKSYAGVKRTRQRVERDERYLQEYTLKSPPPAVGCGCTSYRRGAVFMLTHHVDHALLFRQAAAVVHHGGAGTCFTVACVARIPSVVVPCAFDQAAWGQLMMTRDVVHGGALPPALVVALDDANATTIPAAVTRVLQMRRLEGSAAPASAPAAGWDEGVHSGDTVGSAATQGNARAVITAIAAALSTVPPAHAASAGGAPMRLDSGGSPGFATAALSAMADAGVGTAHFATVADEAEGDGNDDDDDVELARDSL